MHRATSCKPHTPAKKNCLVVNADQEALTMGELLHPTVLSVVAGGGDVGSSIQKALKGRRGVAGRVRVEDLHITLVPARPLKVLQEKSRAFSESLPQDLLEAMGRCAVDDPLEFDRWQIFGRKGNRLVAVLPDGQWVSGAADRAVDYLSNFTPKGEFAKILGSHTLHLTVATVHRDFSTAGLKPLSPLTIASPELRATATGPKGQLYRVAVQT